MGFSYVTAPSAPRAWHYVMAPAHLRSLVIALYTWGVAAGHVCLISEFGPLDPTGARLSTPALQAGLDACADGGTLVFDLPGAFLTGGLVAHGTIHIRLPESVRLLASDRVRTGTSPTAPPDRGDLGRCRDTERAGTCTPHPRLARTREHARTLKCRAWKIRWGGHGIQTRGTAGRVGMGIWQG